MTQTVQSIVDSLVKKDGEAIRARAEKGIMQAAHLWRAEDGSEADFKKYCTENFLVSETERDSAFQRLSFYFESLWGNYNLMSLQLQRYTQLDLGPVLPIDNMFAAYSPSAHVTDDLFDNKIAFLIIINFPYFSLDEKNNLGTTWNRRDWAFARMGDMFTSRVPAAINQQIAKALADADMYISEYNIFAGNLRNNEGDSLFPKGLTLLSHWNLRDEIKASYGKQNGLPKQEMLYEVMKRIITQQIPKEVINSDKYTWNPILNKVSDGKTEIQFTPEPDTRYQMILNNFRALKAEDQYFTGLDTYIKRSFEGSMEIGQEEVEKTFVAFIDAPEVKQVAKLIESRLGRKLQPFDLWYDGFKARSAISNDELDAAANKKYPSAEAFKNDMIRILTDLDFPKEKATFIASKVSVDAVRGSGHAWGAQMRNMNSYLRTRIDEKGMNYKGYNIAMHEFGHTVEQTISMHDVDYYALAGVPNTAFTEALAFIFQRRDLEIMGKHDSNPNKDHLMALDNFWALYEIMGVSLVDKGLWQWMYAHPDATASELKNAVINIATGIWNKYYAPVFGVTDQPILAIYSHMISNPLYLSNYSYGHLIDFQLEQYFVGKNLGAEISRIFKQGKLTPREWMKAAVGNDISIKPMLKAVDEALTVLK